MDLLLTLIQQKVPQNPVGIGWLLKFSNVNYFYCTETIAEQGHDNLVIYIQPIEHKKDFGLKFPKRTKVK